MDIQSIKNRFNIIGNSPALNYALEVAVQVANTDLTVLINGESGVVKKLSLKSYTLYLRANTILLLR
jgi:transcriptional regulator with GAF, ATPase, and Fis domain